MSIRLDHVSKTFNQAPVIQRLSLELPDSGIVGISGPSGCGKTTLLRLLAGLDAPDDGRVDGLGQRGVSMVFQEDRLLPWLCALDNVAVVSGSIEMARQWLEKVGLAGFAGYYPAELSGGMKRRVALARALSKVSSLLLLDEPFTGLDDDLKHRLFDLIRQTARERVVVLVTHDTEDLEALSDIQYSAQGPPMRLVPDG